MAGLGGLATTAIITKGLTCGHAPLDPCRTGLITTAFSLYCTVVPPVTPPSTGGGGGWYPHDAWNKFNPGEILDFYQPVDPDVPYYIVPRDQEEKYFRRHKIVKLKIKLGDIEIEKEYAVPEQRAKMVIRALNVMEATMSNITVTASNMKRLVNEATVTVKNLKLKK